MQQMAPRYQEASRARKILMLDEFVAISGYVRKYAIHLLNHPEELELRSQQARPPTMDQKSNKPCSLLGKRPIRSAPNG